MDGLLKKYKTKCIITAIDIEFLALIKQFNIKNEHIYKVNNAFSVAECIDRRLIIAQAGIGKTKAKDCAEVLCNYYPDIYGFLSTGLAGALSDQLKIGDIVIGDSVIDKIQEKYDTIKFLDIPMLTIKEKFHVQYGPVLCSDEFIKETETKQSLFNKYGTLCVDMESSGVVNFARKRGSPFLIIKAISDYANEKATTSFFRSYKMACNLLAQFIDTIINHIFF